MDALTEWARGEPVAIAAIISALLGGVGVYIAPGLIAQLIVATVPVIAAFWKARKHSTPAADPAIPYVVVDPVNGAPVPETLRVRSFSLATRLSAMPRPERPPRRA